MTAPRSRRFIAIAGKFLEQSPLCAGLHESSVEANAGKRDPPAMHLALSSIPWRMPLSGAVKPFRPHSTSRTCLFTRRDSLKANSSTPRTRSMRWSTERKFKISDFTTFATILFAALDRRVPLTAIQRFGGHASIKMTLRNAHF